MIVIKYEKIEKKGEEKEDQEGKNKKNRQWLESQQGGKENCLHRQGSAEMQ